MNDSTRRWLWLAFYFLVLLAPLIIVMIGPRPGPREFWRELSVAFGFTGLALMGVQFIPTTRLQSFSHLFSMDEVYYYHLRAALVGFLLVLAHPLILFFFNPTSVLLLNPLTAPARAVFGLVSLVALIGLVITSIYRKELSIKYEVWRFLHATFAITMVLTAMLHILGVDYYLAMPAQRVLWVALTVLWIGLILNNRAIRPISSMRRPYKVTEVQRETRRVWTLTVEPDGHEGIRFLPGQFAWLTIGRPAFALRQHPFSIASSATTPKRLEFTIAEAGDFTSGIGQVPVGEVVYVDGPHGTFSIDEQHGSGYVFIAGGIGSPPIMSMLRTMADREDKTPAWLFYGNHTWEDITYREELEQLKQRIDLKVVHVLEDPPETWDGETGFITADVLDRGLPEKRDGLVYFICGPVQMIEPVLVALKSIGARMENVHTEQYDMV